MAEAYDPRITPARPDLAAASLEGQVEATRFVDPNLFQVTAGIAAVRANPSDDATMTTQVQLGELVDIYEERQGWGWGQLKSDGYVGWLDMAALSAPATPATHRVCALRTYVFSEPNLKSPPHFLASLNSRVTALEADGDWVRAERAGWIYSAHLNPLETFERDYVAVAERFRGAPYLWGGKESLGLDCSGLVQSALAACGIVCPRDSDMQEAALGDAVDIPEDLSGLQRGDLIFWRGHVGVMTDAETLLHANAHHMATQAEPLSEMLERTHARVGPITCVKRFS